MNKEIKELCKRAVQLDQFDGEYDRTDARNILRDAQSKKELSLRIRLSDGLCDEVVSYLNALKRKRRQS